jgi:isopentenyl phosphate kinase
MTELVMLKLGGSLITDKNKAHTPRRELLADLIRQIAEVLTKGRVHSPGTGVPEAKSGLRLILGHGSGSFGHTAAKQHGTRGGVELSAGQSEVENPDYWKGFAEVRYRAAELNALVMEQLHRFGVPAAAFPPSASVVTRDQQVLTWEITPIRMALAVGILPVVYGDAVFDESRGGTVLSTEELFLYLARELRPQRILLAGLEAGVWRDFPAKSSLIEEITPRSYDQMRTGVKGSLSVDVTGGMESKVRQMLDLVQDFPGMMVRIFSGEGAGAVKRVLLGEKEGTLLRAE